MTAVGVCDRCQYPERDHGVGFLQTCLKYKSGTGKECRRCGCDLLRHIHYRSGKAPHFLTRGMRVRHVLFEVMCYLLALGVLLGIIYYLKWIF